MIPSRVAQARVKAAMGLHPFWQLQMQRSQRRRNYDLEGDGLSADGRSTERMNGALEPKRDKDGRYDS